MKTLVLPLTSSTDKESTGASAALRETLAATVNLQRNDLSWIVSEVQSVRQAIGPDLHDRAERIRETLFQHVYELMPFKGKLLRRGDDDAHPFVCGGNTCTRRPDWKVRWQQIVYVRLSQLIINYVALHAAAQSIGHAKLADLSLRHLNHLQRLARELRETLPGLVVASGREIPS